jgi:hypothetical protein
MKEFIIINYLILIILWGMKYILHLSIFYGKGIIDDKTDVIMKSYYKFISSILFPLTTSGATEKEKRYRRIINICVITCYLLLILAISLTLKFYPDGFVLNPSGRE